MIAESVANWRLVLRIAIRVIALGLAGALLGRWLGNSWAGVAAALALVLGWEWLNLARLLAWLRVRSIDAAPDASGAWGEVVLQVLRFLRSRRRRKRQFMRLLRTIRRASAALPDGVILLTAQAEISWFNRVAAQLLRLERGTDRGMRIDNLVRQPEFSAYLRSGRFQEPVLVRMSGTPESFLNLHLVPFGDDQQLLLVRDVTQATRIEVMRKDFVANASHELRSPLTVISGYLETLTTEPDIDPALAGPLQEMQRQAQRMNSIVADLLSLSRLETSEREVQGAPVDVGMLLEHCQRDILSRPQHPASVTVTIDTVDRLMGENDQLYSLARNLMENAANYTPPGGAIAARWWTDAEGGHLQVRDTGIGIAPEHIPRLTERFYRVDVGRSRTTGGSGLGLAIVKHVLQKHGGRLDIASTPGTGSSFTCHFPPRRVTSGTHTGTAVAL